MIPNNVDSLMPSEMALQAELIGVSKANMSQLKTLVLSMLAGAFIAFGSIFYTSVTTNLNFPYGISKLIGGFSFSLGLILVIVGGAELFTGNNLIIMAWANKKIDTSQVVRNWILVFIGNMIGTLFIAILMFFSRSYLFASGAVGVNMLNIAKTKCELGFLQAIVLGIMCNILVCLAIWLCFSTRSAAGKIIAIVFPVTAFVASGFEHSIANMYFIPEALLILKYGDSEFLALLKDSMQNYESVTWSNYLWNNLLPVSIGNIIGGAVLVGLVYWFVFLRDHKTNTEKN
jgi:formate/nitrite transporter